MLKAIWTVIKVIVGLYAALFVFILLAIIMTNLMLASLS